jgi:hypothetical protein
MSFKQWVRLPSAWIEEGGLRKLRWGVSGKGSDNTAALMALAGITYDRLCDVTSLSRAKLSNGLDVLARIEVVQRIPEGRSTYKLANYNPQRGWAKLPAKSMYSGGRIVAFGDFGLRRIAELDALKVFFLFVARRGRDTNMAHISYDKIQDYTGIERARIKTAISFLASRSLVYVEQFASKSNDLGIANAYRIVGVDTYTHMGTRGRLMDLLDSN